MSGSRPQLTLVPPAASPEEAAAVVAAIERFRSDHAPAIAPAEEPMSGWVRAARLEAVDATPVAHPWLP